MAAIFNGGHFEDFRRPDFIIQPPGLYTTSIYLPQKPSNLLANIHIG